MLWVSSLHEWIKYRDFCEISMIFSEILTFVFFAISRFFLLKMLLLVFAMNTRYLSGFLKTFLFSVRDFPVLLPLYFLWIFEGFFFCQILNRFFFPWLLQFLYTAYKPEILRQFILSCPLWGLCSEPIFSDRKLAGSSDVNETNSISFSEIFWLVAGLRLSPFNKSDLKW